MFLKIKYLLFFMVLILLVGCQKEDYSLYLIQHPKALEKAYTQCQQQPSALCGKINETAEEFSRLYNEMSLAPERFGQQIIKLQQEIREVCNGDAKSVSDCQQKQRELDQCYGVVATTMSENL